MRRHRQWPAAAAPLHLPFQKHLSLLTRCAAGLEARSCAHSPSAPLPPSPAAAPSLLFPSLPLPLSHTRSSPELTCSYDLVLLPLSLTRRRPAIAASMSCPTKSSANGSSMTGSGCPVLPTCTRGRLSRACVPTSETTPPVYKGTAVIDGSFRQISLSDYRGKWLVLFFYPLAFKFVCPTEIIASSAFLAGRRSFPSLPFLFACVRATAIASPLPVRPSASFRPPWTAVSRGEDDFGSGKRP